jgi:hypothetical protein
MTELLAVVLACVLAVVLVAVAALLDARLHRLDRLHARLDAARDALLVALQGRHDAALAAARALDCRGARVSAELRAAVAAAGAAGRHWPDRETAENALGRTLAGVDRAALPAAVRTELAEAEHALLLARLVHNDAVRDTLWLRSRRLVRWLRLAGSAPRPRYFEIADPSPDVTPTARIGPQEEGANDTI